VEFQQARRQFSTDKAGEYVSALSNEANLRGAASAWLVFGVADDRRTVGTTHLAAAEERQALKGHIQQSIDQGLTIREIHEVHRAGARVVLLEIPAAPRGIPISWKGHYFARAGQSLVPLSLDKSDEIRGQTSPHDWTAVIVPEATLNDVGRQRSPARGRASSNVTPRASWRPTSLAGTTPRSSTTQSSPGTAASPVRRCCSSAPTTRATCSAHTWRS
jgi:predicted HTH transcriptional regulator